MNIAELKTRCPRLYAQVFAAGVNSQRKRALAAELIADAALTNLVKLTRQLG
jgi:hypothetical protein